MAEAPGMLLWDVMEMRAYARTKERVAEAAKGGEGDLEITPMVELVQTIQAELDAEMFAEVKAEVEEAKRLG